MPKFSKKSLAKLETCDPHLIALFTEVVKHFDCTVLEGHRGEAAQNKAFREGRSQKKWPDGEHNKTPSKAADVAPYPIDWEDKERFYFFAGFVHAIAIKMGLKIRWGGDWDKDADFHDQRLYDLPHFEIVD